MNLDNYTQEDTILKNEFGLITTKKVVINTRNQYNEVPLNQIIKIHLIKTRIPFYNAAFLSMSLFLSCIVAFKWIEDFILKNIVYGIIIVGLLMAIFIKIYQYCIIIKLLNQREIQIKTRKRNSLKKFYFSLRKLLKKQTVVQNE